ncbi:unnamed protein product, partial [Ilex paraguariensis]
MSLLEGLIETLGSLFTDSPSTSSIESRENPSNRAMDTEEIAKAVRAEEWGLVDDAVLHYQKA